MMAEVRTRQIIRSLQPSNVAHSDRQEIIGFLQDLLHYKFGVEVRAFGSVPLKAYLPDGDIDLTVLSNRDTEKELVFDVYNALIEQGDQNPIFKVSHVKYIPAKVKLVKCVVRDVSVDISFNQMGGLSALCFFEQVDELVGRCHLFKRSVILIKAWCYYESHILGAQFHLLSSYAIEVLTLYIINHFHRTLAGPLSVLNFFMDYYAKFDWNNFCITLGGPVHLSCLPYLLVGALHYDGRNLLLSRNFVNHCQNVYSIPIQAVEDPNRPFPVKYMNIVDPLRVNNNLGLSVSKCSVRQIISVFDTGARLIGHAWIRQESLHYFLKNTLRRIREREWAVAEMPQGDVDGARDFKALDLSGDFTLHYSNLLDGQMYHGYRMPAVVRLVGKPSVLTPLHLRVPRNCPFPLVESEHYNVSRELPPILGPPPFPFTMPVLPPDLSSLLPADMTLPSARGNDNGGRERPHKRSRHRAKQVQIKTTGNKASSQTRKAAAKKPISSQKSIRKAKQEKGESSKANIVKKESSAKRFQLEDLRDFPPL